MGPRAPLIDRSAEATVIHAPHGIYIIWLRFQRAWELAGEGRSLSSAAHGAGFPTPRTSPGLRRLFGAPPVAIQIEKP